MPVFDDADHHCAHRIISDFGDNAQILVASSDGEGEPLLGCVLGGILDAELIAAYRLAGFGARAGDGVLAYIAVPPAAQGSRVVHLSDDVFEVHPARIGGRWRKGSSLAGALFAGWLANPAVAQCPRVFVRTREVIRPVLHLIEKNGFEYRGRFELEFRGERQDRLVFGRSNV